MFSEWIGILAMYGPTVLLAIPLGRYSANVFADKSTLFDFMRPLERLIYRLGGINEMQAMSWKANLFALLTINAVWLVSASCCCWCRVVCRSTRMATRR